MTQSINYKEYVEPKSGDPDWSQFYAEALEGRIANVQENNPQAGYYKWRFKGETWRGLAIFEGKNGLQFLSVAGNGAEPVNITDPHERMQMWTWCPRNPITKTVFKEFMDTGKWRFLDNKPALSNLPADPFEALKLELANKIDSAEEMLKRYHNSGCLDKETADLAVNIEREISAMIGKADKLHKKEKDHWLQGGRAVDAKFRFRSEIQTGILARIKDFYKRWQVKEQKRLNAEAEVERKRLAEEARLKLEAEQEKAEAYAEQFPGVSLDHVTTEPERIPEVKAQRVQSGGGFGSRAGLRKDYRPRLVNLKLALANYGDCEEVLAALNTIAYRVAKRDKEDAFVWGFEIVNELDEVISDGVTPKKEAA